jgi:hypothetical protein
MLGKGIFWKGQSKEQTLTENDLIRLQNIVPNISSTMAVFAIILSFSAFYLSALPNRFGDALLGVWFFLRGTSLCLGLIVFAYTSKISKTFQKDDRRAYTASLILILLPIVFIFTTILIIGLLLNFDVDEFFPLALLIFFSIPVIGTCLLAMTLNKILYKTKNRRRFLKFNALTYCGFGLTLFLILLVSFPDSILTGMAAGIVVLIVGAAAVLMLVASSVIISVPKLILRSLAPSKYAVPRLFLLQTAVLIVLTVLFIVNSTYILTRTELTLDEEGLNVEGDFNSTKDVVVTVYNLGGMPAEGNITLVLREIDRTYERTTVLGNTTRIDGFGTWEVEFTVDSVHNKTVAVYWNGDKKDEMHLEVCDYIAVIFVVLAIAAVQQVQYGRLKKISG